MHSQSCVHSLVACELSGALTCLLPSLQPKPILSCCIAQTIVLPQVDISDAVRAAIENGDLPPHIVEEAPSILSLCDSATCSSDQNPGVPHICHLACPITVGASLFAHACGFRSSLSAVTRSHCMPLFPYATTGFVHMWLVCAHVVAKEASQVWKRRWWNLIWNWNQHWTAFLPFQHL